MLFTNENYSFTKTLVISALLLSISIIVNYFTKMTIPIAEAPVVRIALGAPFLRFIGLLFGPVWGGIAPALSDVIGFLTNPQGGSYIWPLTLVAFAKGFFIAFIWHSIKKISFRIYNTIYLASFLILLIIGVINLTVTNFFPASAYGVFILSAAKYTSYVSIGLIIVGCIGLFFQIALWFAVGRGADNRMFEMYLKLIISIAIPSLVFTTLNTFILMKFLSWTMPFAYFLVPRILEELLTILFNTYMVVALCGIYEKAFGAEKGRLL